MRKIFCKYQILRVRMKISYHALMRNYTITEIFLRQIISSFRYLKDSDQIVIDNPVPWDEEELLNQILKGEITCGL